MGKNIMTFLALVNFFIGSIALPINAYWWATGDKMWILGLFILPGWVVGYFRTKEMYCDL